MWSWPEQFHGDGRFLATEDGSRSGPKGLRLLDELAKGKKVGRGSHI